MRYGVRFERLLGHLEDLCAEQPHRATAGIGHIDDLVHAVACIDGDDLAWRDLVEQHERALVRACRQWLDATDAIVFVRRLVAQLRRNEQTGVRSLRSFDGTNSLRRWLGDRIVGALNRSGVGLQPSRPPDLDQAPEALATDGTPWLRPPAAGRT
jgi:hypothetical protein